MLHALLLVFALPASSDDGPLLPVELQELTPAEVTANDGFGHSLAIDGGLAVAGAPFDDDAGQSSGSAYVLRATPGGWQSEARLTRPGAEPGDHFGWSVAVSGELVAVGAHLADEAGTDSGAVHIFARVGSSWVHEQMLSGSSHSEFFGASLALEGERLAVGTGWMWYTGRVDIFERRSGAWTLVQVLAGTSTDFSQAFGNSVDLDGERLIVGSPQLDQGGLLGAGAAFVYRLQGGSFVQEAMLTSPYQATGSWEGWAVALDGALAVIGAPTWMGAGSAHAFSRESGTWEYERLLVAPPVEDGDRFGHSVAIDGEVIMVGAEGRSTLGNQAGLAFVFQRQGSTFRLSSSVSPADHEAGQHLGSSVALHGATLLVGSRSDDDHASGAGSVHAFELDPALRGYCFGDGSATPCPCGNSSSPGEQRGCVNSSGTGATISGSRSVSVAADDLLLRGSRLAPGQPAVLFVGTAAVSSGAGRVLGDGLLCAGGAAMRLGVQQAGPSGGAQFGPGLAAPGGWSAGDTRYFQLWFRDPSGPCGQGVNLSAALEARFTP